MKATAFTKWKCPKQLTSPAIDLNLKWWLLFNHTEKSIRFCFILLLKMILLFKMISEHNWLCLQIGCWGNNDDNSQNKGQITNHIGTNNIRTATAKFSINHVLLLFDVWSLLKWKVQFDVCIETKQLSTIGLLIALDTIMILSNS